MSGERSLPNQQYTTDLARKFDVLWNGTLCAEFLNPNQPEEIFVTVRLAFAAAAALCAAVASIPASAEEVIYNPGYCAQFYPNANCQNKGTGNPYTDRRSNYLNSRNSAGDSDNAGLFAPAVAAAGVAAGTVGAAGTIATAPFRGDRYAYANGYKNEFVARNDFVCQPGTLFKGDDGRMHPCQ